MQPKVSILIPCYNAEKWVAQAIESALGQTYGNKEIIVVDDGSTDSSLSEIKAFGDAIRVETGSNRGGNAARNRLLELSTGEWLQYLDADDYLLPDKITQQVEFLSQHPDTDVVYSPSVFDYWRDNQSNLEVLPIPEPRDPWILLARWYLPQTGSPLWRRQALLDVGGWKPDQPCCQEHELYLRLLMAGKRFEYCSDSNSVYRQWSEATLCKKNKPEVYHHRLVITDRLEAHLASAGELTPSRQYAINLSRFDCARIIWLSNPEWAKQIINSIRKNDLRFKPSGDAAPSTYQVTFQFFGFEAAERIAFLKRKVFQ
jgi:glycosyltransferase involved in cell wall biosynthesis